MYKVKPYPKQVLAINSILTGEFGLKYCDRTQLVMSCGTGKSLTAMWTYEKFINNLNESITILFFPSLFLVNQTYNVYKENITLDFKPMIVCSDTAIGHSEDDEVYEIDISETNYPVTTNIEDIKIYMQDESIKHKIVFVTYHSSQLIGAALNELGIKADLGIFDEAHKTATLNIDSKFAYGLKDENIPMAKRLFMTATPRHIKFNSEDEEEVEVFSMNDVELYGNIAYEYPMREAINDGRITDYKIIGILIDDKFIDSYTKESKPYNDEVINEAKIKAIGKAMDKFTLNKALIFNKDIKASIELEKYSNSNMLNKTIKHLDGNSKHSYREEVLKELKESEQYIITNAKLFTEGVNLPAIDMIALFRNVKSEIDIIQTVGRVQRIDRNNLNKVGYILLPIIISNIDNIDDELKTNKDLEYIYELINSLKENDEQLRATLEYKKQNNSKSNKPKNKKDSEIKNPNFEVDYLSDDASDFINEINERIAYKIEAVILNKRGEKKSDKEWKDLFVEFIKENGIENLYSTTKFKNENLGAALSRLKIKYNKENPTEQKEMREFWDCFSDEVWERKIPEPKTDKEWKELFIEFIKENGVENLNGYTRYNNENLGNTLSTLKTKYNKANSTEQKEMREFWDCFSDGFLKTKKTPEPKTDKEWKELFVEFIKENGIENLKTTTKFKNENLGNTLSTLKTKYNKANSTEQKEMREFWDCFSDDFWERKAPKPKTDKEWKELFIEFIKENGVENLNTTTKFKNENLGNKLHTLRKKYNKITPDEQKETREFWDCFSDDFWERKVPEFKPKTSKEWKELFVEFIKEKGIENLNRKTEYKNENLGNALKEIRQKYSKANSNKQKEMREFWDCFSDDFWERKAPKPKTDKEWKELFVEFIKEKGIENLNRKTEYKNENLGNRLGYLRQKYSKATPDEQKEMREFWDCFPDGFLGTKKANKV